MNEAEAAQAAKELKTIYLIDDKTSLQNSDLVRKLL